MPIRKLCSPARRNRQQRQNSHAKHSEPDSQSVVIKMDHILRDQDHLSGSWIYDHKPRTLDDGGGVCRLAPKNGGPLSNARIQTYWEHEVRLNETHTFTPHLLKYCQLHLQLRLQCQCSGRPQATGILTLGFGDTGANTFPMINFADNSAYGPQRDIPWQHLARETTSGANIITGDSLTWTKGAPQPQLRRRYQRASSQQPLRFPARILQLLLPEHGRSGLSIRRLRLRHLYAGMVNQGSEVCRTISTVGKRESPCSPRTVTRLTQNSP